MNTNYFAGSECDGSEASARASTITLFSSLIITIPGLLIIGFYGSFADRYGLKKTLSIPVLGNFIFAGCIFLSMQQSWSPYYAYVLLFGSLCSGLSGNVRYCNVLLCIVFLCCATAYCTLLYRTIMRCILLYCSVRYSIVLYCGVMHFIVTHCIGL